MDIIVDNYEEEIFPDLLAWNRTAWVLLEKLPLDEINWKFLSCNENAVPFLRKHMDRIDWEMFSCENENFFLPEDTVFEESDPDLLIYGPKDDPMYASICWPNIMERVKDMSIIKKYPGNIEWLVKYLCKNPYAIDIVAQYPDNIDWSELSANPSIFIEDSESEIQ